MVIKLGYHNDPPPIDNNRSHVEEKTGRGKNITTTAMKTKKPGAAQRSLTTTGLRHHQGPNTRNTDGSPNKQQRKLKRESNHTEGGLEEDKGKRQDVDGGTLHHI